MLRNLRLRDVGPAASFDVDLAERLNVFTGDNGLGKTFILDIAWWALTGTWAGPPALPQRGGAKVPRIEYCLRTDGRFHKMPIVSMYDLARQVWPRKRPGSLAPSLVVYARVDGSYSVWDPARNYRESEAVARQRQPQGFRFSPETLWNGLSEEGQVLCNGLVRDWVSWEAQDSITRIRRTTKSRPRGNRHKVSPFEVLRRLIEQLVATPGEPISIGTSVRLSPLNSQDMPSLSMPYGDVPIINASAGIKRIASLAYLLTWAWDEHKKASKQQTRRPVEDLVILIDEAESHLHPRWKRTLLPSILEVGNMLKAEVGLQFLATTHSPLVLASLEPHFDEERDKLFWFDLKENRVLFRELPWVKYGDVVGWLTSPIFDLQQARSKEAEEAIEAAKAFVRGDRSALRRGLKTKGQINKRLHELLGARIRSS